MNKKLFSSFVILALLLGNQGLASLPGIAVRPAVAHPGNAPSAAFEPKSYTDYAHIVYIDPNTPTPGDGNSPSSPLASWDDVTFEANTAYVQKRGTTCLITKEIKVNQENVLLGAYGPDSDPRPSISDASTGITHILNVQKNFATLRDLEIVSPRATSGIHFAAGANPTDGVAWNNYIHGVDQSHYLVWAIRVFGDRTRLLYNTIEYTGDDGIFIKDSIMVEVGYNHITRVNQKWFADPAESGSPGDSVQLDGMIDGFHIHHNYADRTDTGNKFCYIANTDVNNTSGIIENNTCLIARDRVPVYLNQYGGDTDSYHVIVRNNYFEYVDSGSGGVGIWNHAALPEIYNNIFKGFARGIVLATGTTHAQIHHNTFSGISSQAVDGSAEKEVFNNIFDLGADADAFSSTSGLTASNNLFVRQSQAVGGNPVTGNPRFANAATGDFHLLPGSAAINAGVPVAGISSDADGNLRDAAPDIGAYELQPALTLHGTAGDQTIYLTWEVNVSLPATTTWTIHYDGPAGDEASPISGIIEPTRAYTLTGLADYAWYDIMLTTSPTMLTDTLRILLTDKRVYLPAIQK